MSPEIPIYPKPQDLVFLIDSMVEVAGAYSRGILYRFGERVGERYASMLEEIEWTDVDPTLGVLGILKASGWFLDVEVHREGGIVEILVHRPFELSSSGQGCDFLRGVLSGLSSRIEGMPTFFVERLLEDGWVSFRGEAKKG